MQKGGRRRGETQNMFGCTGTSRGSCPTEAVCGVRRPHVEQEGAQIVGTDWMLGPRVQGPSVPCGRQ